MATETQYTANTGLATINAANTSLSGSGTLNTDIWTVITGASNGTKVKSVTIKARGSTTALGMVRLFVYDGSNTRLLAEIEVPVVTQSASNECFERYLELDLDLKSGYQLRATTQIADTFNIIAEGLDYAYYTNSVRPESTNYTANTGINIITTANSNLDGTTGSNVTILTAGSSGTYKGCLIKSIVIKAIVSTTVDGMVRFYIQNSAGSVTKLFTEVPVPVVTKGATVRSFAHQVDFPGGFHLQAGYKIIASTEKGNSFTITIEGDDWKYPTDTPIKNFTPASGTSTTSEELLHSLQVPANYVASGSLLNVFAACDVSNNANNKTFRLYVNSSNTLSGATLLGTFISTSVQANVLSRFLAVISDTSIESYGGASTNFMSQYSTATVTTSAITVPSVSAGFWVLISCQKATAGDTDTVRWSMVKKVY